MVTVAFPNLAKMRETILCILMGIVQQRVKNW